jgi:lipopolysaccharide/colanic/teichoic acid biosynthesis glycosyltransferase
VFDISVAAPVLVISFPFLLVIAACIKVSSRGSVLFRQERMGKDQKSFMIYKFRTMCSEKGDGPLVTRRGDHRMTWFGNILRKLKLDELPQLYNVLRGDMSLVGPRPKVVQHEQFELPCKPGLTGAATILFAREEDLLAHVPHEDVETFTVNVLHPIKAVVDRQYASSSTFWTDLRLLVDTALRLRKDREITCLDDLHAWQLYLANEAGDTRMAA